VEQAAQTLQPLQPDAGQDCGATGGCATSSGSKGLEPALFAAVISNGGNGGELPPNGGRPIGEPTWPAPDPRFNFRERREMEGELRDLQRRWNQTTARPDRELTSLRRRNAYRIRQQERFFDMRWARRDPDPVAMEAERQRIEQLRQELASEEAPPPRHSPPHKGV